MRLNIKSPRLTQVVVAPVVKASNAVRLLSIVTIMARTAMPARRRPRRDAIRICTQDTASERSLQAVQNRDGVFWVILVYSYPNRSEGHGMVNPRKSTKPPQQERSFGLPSVFLRHIKVDPVTGHKSMTYQPAATLEASHLTVDAICQMLGISLGRLGVLVGFTVYGNVYAWKSLSKERRPSPLFLSRMIWMLRLKYIDGWDFTTIRTIDWKRGVATFVQLGSEIDIAFQSDVQRDKLRPKRLPAPGH